MDFRRLIMKKAFTMIELVFVIVVVGILSAIAIPKFASTRDDAIVAKGRATVAALRSAIAMERQKRILRGDFTDITGGDATALLDYGLDTTRWNVSGDDFTFKAPNGHICKFSVAGNKFVKDNNNCNVDGMSDL
jgi:general secretion pathway protein G